MGMPGPPEEGSVIARAALSIRQPYAFAILHLGKRIENRGRSDGQMPSVVRVKGPILLHASKWFQAEEMAEQALDCLEIARQTGVNVEALGPVTLRMLKRQSGGIVGRARAIGYSSFPGSLPKGQHAWWCGPYALILDNVAAFAEVIPRDRHRPA
jgi:hypothetical protein